MSNAFDDLGAPSASPTGSGRNSADALRNEVREGIFAPPENVQLVSNPHGVAHNPQGSFNLGIAGGLSPRALANAGVFDTSRPLIGSVFDREERVKYIILHSTETGRPADAETVIDSWNNRRFRAVHSHSRHGHEKGPHYELVHHPGAQFIVDRDGTIYMTANPDKATIHINDRIAKGDVCNDNAIGIEIVHTGHQSYTPQQKASLVKLVSYLQDHYKVSDSHVETHAHVQPQTRKDPVHFDLEAFDHRKHEFRTVARNLYQEQTKSHRADA